MATNGRSSDSTNSSSSAQLERQADATRAQVAATLDQIRSRMSPGQMVDQAIEYARDNGAAEFVRNLGQQVKASPLPVALIGTGIAWLMLSNGQSAAKTSAVGDGAAAVREQWRSASGTLHGAASSVSDAGASAGDSLREAASSVAQASGAMRDTVADAANGIGTTLADAGTSAAGVAASAGESLRDAAASLGNGMPGQQAVMNFAREQPLVLGAVGLALGALLGAMLPSTRTEDELVGASSDAVKEEAKQTAEEQFELAVDAGGRAFNAASEEAEAQGLDLNAASDLAASVGEKAAAVAGAATEAAAASPENTANEKAEEHAGAAAS